MKNVGVILAMLAAAPAVCQLSKGQIAILDVKIKNIRSVNPLSTEISGDIIAINGQSVSGKWTRVEGVTCIVEPYCRYTLPLASEYYSFQAPDGAPFGGMVATVQGLALPGPVNPGRAELRAMGANGIFAGARGTATPVHSDDGSVHRLIVLTIGAQPAVMQDDNGPMVMDSSMARISVASPAIAGQSLVVMATDLGPTTPTSTPGRPFPGTPLPE